MKKKVLMFITVIFLVLFVVSCNKGKPTEPTDTAAALRALQSGTEGVKLNFMPDFPPRTIFDHNPLVIILEVQNKGAHDLAAQDCFIQITGFDPNIITGGMNQPRSCAEGLGVLEGKSLYNLEGTINQLEFHSPNIELPEGVFEYNPSLNFVSCYNYQTIANPSVCVDPLLYQLTQEQKACDYRKGVVVGGGQGAPVAVSRVNVDMVGGQGGSGKAIFEINLVNSGGGKVLSPQTDLQSCGDNIIEYQDLNKIIYDVRLAGGNLVNCKPRDGVVRMNNNKGKIICSFSIPQASAYETPLMITLDYNYLQSRQQSVRIVSTPQ